MKKLSAIFLSITILLGYATICTSAAFGDTLTTSNEIIDISDYGTTTVLFAKHMTAVDNSDDTIQHGAPMTKGADGQGYPYFDGVRKDDYYTFKAKVNTAGIYKMAINFGWSPSVMTGDFTVTVDGGDPVSVINEVVGIDFQTWTLSSEASVVLEEGEHEIKIRMDGYAINLSALCIAPENMAIEPKYPVLLSKSPTIVGGEAFPTEISYSTYAYRFIANAPFDNFAFMLGTHGSHNCKCVISLYKYDTDIGTTLDGEPLVTNVQDPLADNTLVEIPTGDPIPAGEYVAYIDATMLDEENEIFVYTHVAFENYPTGFVYIDEELWYDEIPTFIVNFVEELDSGEYFGQCELEEGEISDETDALEGDGTVAPDGDGTATTDAENTADTAADTTAAPESDNTVSGTVADTAVATKAPVVTTATAPAEGCKAVVGSIPAIALVAVASAAAVVLKKRED